MEAMRGSQKSIVLVARQLGVHIGPGSLVVGIQEYIPIKIKS